MDMFTYLVQNKKPVKTQNKNIIGIARYHTADNKLNI